MSLIDLFWLLVWIGFTVVGTFGFGRRDFIGAVVGGVGAAQFMLIQDGHSVPFMEIHRGMWVPV